MGHSITIDIDFDHVLDFVENAYISDGEASQLAEALTESVKDPQFIKVNNTTIMDGIATKELQEIINKHGVEAVVAQLKQINL